MGCVWEEILATVDGFGAPKREKRAQLQGFGVGAGGILWWGDRRTENRDYVCVHIYIYRKYACVYVCTYIYIIHIIYIIDIHADMAQPSAVLGVVLDHVLGPQLPARRSVRSPSQGVGLLGSGLRLARTALSQSTPSLAFGIARSRGVGPASTERR